MTRADRAQAVLDSLGSPAKRPSTPPRNVSQRICRNGCGQQITLAFLPTGAWCALDREPDGDMVIVGATVRTRGEHHGNAQRYSFHRCST